MKIIGLIGKPLAHSISPVFQQAALDHLRLDARYELWETGRKGLAELAQRMRQPDCLGANVTVPHKETVIPMLDELDPLAARTGAVNTIVNRDGRLRGHNTDVTGFDRALREEGGFDPSGRQVVLLGAGGGGRAATMALVQGKAASVIIFDIAPERAERLARDLGTQSDTVLQPLRLSKANLATAISTCHLLVNCTPIGMRHTQEEHQLPIPAELIPPQGLVFDIIYNPPESRFLAEAKRRGARTLGGLPMLVYQGADSFELWTGMHAPIEVMFKAAREALGPTAMKGSEH